MVTRTKSDVLWDIAVAVTCFEQLPGEWAGNRLKTRINLQSKIRKLLEEADRRKVSLSKAQRSRIAKILDL